jgi:tryptophan synthase beta subunit
MQEPRVKKNVSKEDFAMTPTVSDEGFYGGFGGAYVPEMLYPNVRELQERYLEIMECPEFKSEPADSAACCC